MPGMYWDMMLTQISHKNVSLIVYPSTAPLSREVPTDVGVTYVQAAVLGDMICSLMAEI